MARFPTPRPFAQCPRSSSRCDSRPSSCRFSSLRSSRELSASRCPPRIWRSGTNAGLSRRGVAGSRPDAPYCIPCAERMVVRDSTPVARLRRVGGDIRRTPYCDDIHFFTMWILPLFVSGACAPPDLPCYLMRNCRFLAFRRGHYLRATARPAPHHPPIPQISRALLASAIVE